MGKKTNKNKPSTRKPFLDALFEQPEGFQLPVKIRHVLQKKDEKVILITIISPVDKFKYQGEIVSTAPLLERQPLIVRPTNGIIKPN